MLALGFARTQSGAATTPLTNLPRDPFLAPSSDLPRSCPQSTLRPPALAPALTHLEDVVGTLATQVVLAGQDHHRLGEHLQADGADELLLQVVHAVCIREQRLETHREVHSLCACARPGRGPGPLLPLDPSLRALDDPGCPCSLLSLPLAEPFHRLSRPLTNCLLPGEPPPGLPPEIDLTLTLPPRSRLLCPQPLLLSCSLSGRTLCPRSQTRLRGAWGWRAKGPCDIPAPDLAPVTRATAVPSDDPESRGSGDSWQKQGTRTVYRERGLARTPCKLLEPPSPWLSPWVLLPGQSRRLHGLSEDRHCVRLGTGAGEAA